MASEYLKWKYRDVRPDVPAELNTKQKRANWWYYHKWYVALAVFLCGLAVYLLARALGFGAVRPDYQVAYVGSSPLPEDTASALETALGALGGDCNGDGHVTVRINQYVMGSDSGNSTLYAYAGSTKLMANLDSCDSYFFLLEDPEAFQENYQVLRRLDGSLPADGERDYEACYLAWNDCPALQALPLGEYTETVLGQEIHGDSQKRLSSLFVARRGFWTSRTAEYADECDALWIAMTGGSSR